MNIDKMILGYNLSQKKKVIIGNYMVKFHRRKVSRRYDYLYVIEIFFMDSLVKRGIFTEYSNAVDFAGEFLYSLL
jgi:hypothetical protein